MAQEVGEAEGVKGGVGVPVLVPLVVVDGQGVEVGRPLGVGRSVLEGVGREVWEGVEVPESIAVGAGEAEVEVEKEEEGEKEGEGLDVCVTPELPEGVEVAVIQGVRLDDED